MTSHQWQVADTFLNFYSNLFKSQSNYTSEEIRSYLHTIQFPRLNLNQIKILDTQITTQDISTAISQLAKSKAPGLDGPPLEFYTMYSEILTPKLKILYHSIFELGKLPSSMQEAQIIVLPQPGKDPHLPESYRPISLLPVNIKILAKILASRFKYSNTIPYTPGSNWIYGRKDHRNEY